MGLKTIQQVKPQPRVEGGGMLRPGADSSFRPEWTVVQLLEEKCRSREEQGWLQRGWLWFCAYSTLAGRLVSLVSEGTGP